MKNKNHMVISRNAEKPFDKTQHPFMAKILNAMGTEETYFNIRKAMHYKLTGRIILDSEVMEATRMSTDRRMDKEDMLHIYNGIFLSHKRAKFVERVIVMMWVDLRVCHTSKVSQKEKNKYCILMQIYGV